MTTVGDGLFQYGGMPVGLDHLCPAEVHMLTRASTSSTTYEPYKVWSRKWPKRTFHTTLAAAYAATTSKQNQVILASPDHHGVTETLTWANYDTHLIGMTVPSPLHPRTSIGHGSTAVTPMLTVSGRGCLFANLYLTYGLVAEDLIACRVTYRENMFQNVHFSTPRNSAAGDIATHYALSVESEYNYFKNCVIGNDIQPRDGTGSVINFSGDAKRNVFENCLIKIFTDDVTPFFIRTASGAQKFQLFKNCTFVCTSVNQADPLTYAISHGSGSASELVFDNCTFAGVTDIVAAGQESLIWIGPTVYDGAAATATGLAQHPDVD